MQAAVASVDVILEPLAGISGRHVRRHEPSGKQLLKADIELSPDGLRVVQGERGAELEMIRSFSSGSVWLIDRARRVSLELLIDDEGGLAMSAVPGMAGGFLQSEPCGDAMARREGVGQWRGRAVEVFACLDATRGSSTIEMRDDEYGIVVFRRTADGIVDEIQRIRSRQYDPDHFKPRERDRAVEDQEFFTGTPPIKPYQESEAIQ